MIRERGLLEIEMYKRARQQFCSRGYILPFFLLFFLKPVGKEIFSTDIVHTYKINRGCRSPEFCPCLPNLCPTPITGWALALAWGSQRGAEIPEAEGAAGVKIGGTEYCTLTPFVEGAFHPRGLLPPVGFPRKPQLFIISIQDE